MASHLVAAGRLLDDDPALALQHAQAARRQAGRVPSVREAVGMAAYLAGEWQTAIIELRAYRRLSGSSSYLPVIADAERALGRPERAIDLAASPDAERLELATRMELLIVAAGARRDLGQVSAAVVTLQVPELSSDTAEPWLARLRYAYADALLADGRRDEARDWYVSAAEVDHAGETDAADHVLELDGIVLEPGDELDDEDPAEDVDLADDADLPEDDLDGDIATELNMAVAAGPANDSAGGGSDSAESGNDSAQGGGGNDGWRADDRHFAG